MPAYNVEKTIGKLLNQMIEFKKDVIIIDDGSSDNTYQIVVDNGFEVIKQEKNRGVSAAIKRGIDYALDKKYKRAIFMDSDGQHSPKYLYQFTEMLKKYDFVIGNRFSEKTIAPDIKKCSNLLVSMIIKKLSGQKYNDIACGFKAIKLSRALRNYLDDSREYSVVYDLFFYALAQNFSIGTLDIEPSYEYNQLLFTRRIELLSFIESVERNYPENIVESIKIPDLKNKVIYCGDFIYNILEIDFYGFFIKEHDGYIIQADRIQIELYMKE